MRAARSSSRRRLVFVLVGGAHACLILRLAHPPHIKSRDQEVESVSMAMILFPPPSRSATDRPPSTRRTAVHRPTPLHAAAVTSPALPPTPIPDNTGNAIDWDLERQRAAQAMVQPPTTRSFGSLPRAQVAEPRRDAPLHEAGETYVDTYGDRIVWITGSCYLVSEAPELGVPEAFKRVKPTRGGCIRQGPGEGELFKDLPEYQKRHPQ